MREKDINLKLERSNLKDQAADILRDHIISGHILPDTKLTERRVSEMLGVSRAPARDALMQLDKKGLVISKSDARYVIELAQEDVDQLCEVRTILERLAVVLAIGNMNAEHQADLLATVQKMEEAIANQDQAAFSESDVDMHRAIWEQSQNPYLLNSLEAMTGPVFMLVASNVEKYDWQEALELHQDLTATLISGDEKAALASLDKHMENSLERVLGLFV